MKNRIDLAVEEIDRQIKYFEGINPSIGSREGNFAQHLRTIREILVGEHVYVANSDWENFISAIKDNPSK